ncbi:MAG: DUF4127 family protein [Selenomonadaceae bacterium]|nr:DUF4127 family protein [Selenomonadaceae bacterium]
MRILFQIFLTLTLILMTTARADAAGEKILYIPVDDRPITFKQTAEVVTAAGYEMILPPKNYLSRYDNGQSFDKLWSWLEENISNVDAAVISADAVIYGGLIPSRKHEISESDLDARINRFKALREKNPHLKIYVLASLMRAPHEGTAGSVEEPDYYAQYGADIFRYTSLAYKGEVSGLTSGEHDAMYAIQNRVPTEFLNDWLSRRKKNLDVTKKLIDLTDEGIINYLIIGRDDHWTFSQTQRESNELTSYAQKNNIPKYKLQMLSGVDEFGLVLLARAVDDLRGDIPKVFVAYNKGTGAETIPAYSDETVANSIESELTIAGGELVNNPESADLVFLVNTDPAGETYHSHNSSPFSRSSFDYNSPRDGTKYFVDMVERYVNEGYPVCVADITFGNGADNPMMNMLKERGLLFKLQAYAGWNTATNSIGYSLSTGILARHMSTDAKDKLLATRYLDDWAYQANVRTTVGDWIYYNIPDGEKFYSNFGGRNFEIEDAITKLMREFAAKNLPPYDYLRDFNVTCAWNRMFEIDIEFSE